MKSKSPQRFLSFEKIQKLKKELGEDEFNKRLETVKKNLRMNFAGGKIILNKN